MKLVDKSLTRYTLRIIAKCGVDGCLATRSAEGEGTIAATAHERVTRLLEATGWVLAGGSIYLCPEHAQLWRDHLASHQATVVTGSPEGCQIRLKEGQHDD